MFIIWVPCLLVAVYDGSVDCCTFCRAFRTFAASSLLFPVTMSEDMAGFTCPAPAPPHPFVRPAFDAKVDQAYAEMKRVLNQELIK